MEIIKRDLANATAAHEQAAERLRDARAAFEAGALSTYAQLRERRDALKDKVASLAIEATAQKSNLSAAMRLANYERTDEVKAALRQKSEADIELNELKDALIEVEAGLLRLEYDAAVVVQKYQQSHREAVNSHAQLQFSEAIAEHAPPLARAIARMQLSDAHSVAIASRQGVDKLWFFTNQVGHALHRLAKQENYADASSESRAAVGDLDLGELIFLKDLRPTQLKEMHDQLQVYEGLQAD
ncbi:hypothetical protein [Ottowia sp.]|uniref:hypothetical protein n=1 Tax=Ottowia sp. TaxID=1898956 RepID=UPI0026069B6E|nr:hypothetical protein [Ottowia sp.]